MSADNINDVMGRLARWSFGVRAPVVSGPNPDDLKALLSYTRQCREALVLVAEGYFIECKNDRFVVMENPNYQPDNGSDPFVIFDTGQALSTQPGDTHE